MKTSLNNVSRTEDYLLDNLSAEEALLYHAELIISSELRTDTFFHRMVHYAVRMYHRKKLKAEIAVAGGKLFDDPSKKNFRDEVMTNFNPEK